MKKALIASFIFVSTLCISNPTFAQMAVVDPQAIATAVENQTQSMEQWAKQYQQMMQQYQQLQKNYAAITGNRGLGDIFNDPALKNYLPSGWQNQYSSLSNKGLDGLSSDAKKAYNSSVLFDRCALESNVQTKTICYAQSVKALQDLSFVNGALQKTQDRDQQIQDLMNQVNATTDQKSALEIQARIAAEQAMIHNEETKLNLFQANSQLQGQVMQERARQDLAQSHQRSEGFTPVEVDFSGN